MVLRTLNLCWSVKNDVNQLSLKAVRGGCESDQQISAWQTFNRRKRPLQYELKTLSNSN